MRNERLKEALMQRQKTIDDVVRATNVDPKTVQRWLRGRVPYARHRWAVAQLLNMRENDLWDLQEVEYARMSGSINTLVASLVELAVALEYKHQSKNAFLLLKNSRFRLSK